jgi:hypothetical protein
MKIYFFGADIDILDKLYDSWFDGGLFLFNSQSGDAFTRIARKLNKDKQFKYMVALRPYVMSPQYLVMINDTFYNICSRNNKLQINLISGHIKEEEKGFGGIIGEVNDSSPGIDKSKYLIDFVHVINNFNKEKIPDIYISATNQYTFDVAKQYGHKVIMPYSQYLSKEYDLDPKNTMISIGPILRDSESDFGGLLDFNHPNDSKYFTPLQFKDTLDQFKREGFKEVIIFGWPDKEKERVIEFVKKYKEGKI